MATADEVNAGLFELFDSTEVAQRARVCYSSRKLLGLGGVGLDKSAKVKVSSILARPVSPLSVLSPYLLGRRK